MKPNNIRVAVTQAEPEWLDLAAAVEKTCKLITEAASNNAQLIAFPEAWIPGYPAWIWSRPCDPELMTAYIKNSLVVSSAEMEQIAACAAANSITVSLGYSERDGDSLYIGQCLITSSGIIKGKRRKLKATHMERTVFGDASGDSLYNVVETELGRVGHLACWEHIQPLLKYHTITQREQIHVAAWPPLYDHQGEELWSMSTEGSHSLARAYAAESQAFVLHCTQVLTQKGVDRMNSASGMLMNRPGGGCSAIFGPDGRKLSEDLDGESEGIIYADINLDDILKVKAFADCCGHYSRPDLLWLGVDAREKKHLKHMKEESNE